jgi:hypothetical protein
MFQRLAALREVRACLMLRVFALSRRVLAQLRRAKHLVFCGQHALRACSTQKTKSDERRRREQANVMEIRQTLRKEYSDNELKRSTHKASMSIAAFRWVRFKFLREASWLRAPQALLPRKGRHYYTTERLRRLVYSSERACPSHVRALYPLAHIQYNKH